MDRKLLVASALALGLAAHPAPAQLAPLSSPAYSFNKSEAILGGTSKLAAFPVVFATSDLPVLLSGYAYDILVSLNR